MTTSGRPARPGSEAGVVVDWLLKVILLIGVLGVVGVEMVGILLARYNAAEGASAAATQAALGIRTGDIAGNPQDLASTAAGRHGCELISLERKPESEMVVATVERKARTFFVHNVGPLEKFTVARATEDASYAGS